MLDLRIQREYKRVLIALECISRRHYWHLIYQTAKDSVLRGANQYQAHVVCITIIITSVVEVPQVVPMVSTSEDQRRNANSHIFRHHAPKLRILLVTYQLAIQGCVGQ